MGRMAETVSITFTVEKAHFVFDSVSVLSNINRFKVNEITVTIKFIYNVLKLF